LVLDDILMEEGEERWYDPGSVLHGDRSFTLKPLGDERPVFYTSTRNSLWERVENLVAPEDPGVKAIVSDLRSQYGEGYNVDHAVAAFHYVRRNIDYEIELPGEDKWQSPGETLRVGRGDCEDHSLLLASIITGLGGGVRINVISGHAFPTIYLGSTTEEANTLWRAVERFYDLDSSLPSEARPSPCWIVDDGYWLCADTLGGLYLGGLPVNAAPTYPPSYSSSSSAASSSASLQTWEWSFTSTMVVSMIPA
ncbi:MAG: transglutaminase domain-containing protein, partial [Thermoplasmata archaeon]|nr:transglutaminase domain-containing protein [Thermoplasmata archaeon]